MADFNRRGGTLEPSAERRPRGSRFGELGDRFARTFSKVDQTQSGTKTNGNIEHPPAGEPPEPWDDTLPPFPITRQGYDCAAVDEHVSALEQELADLDRELAELRVHARSKGEVAAEMERIGDQTSAILIAAHEQAQETTRLAKAQADRCIADAASNAIATTADAQRQLREMESEKVAVGRERERLLEDVRGVAAALSSLADEAATRFPAGSEVADPPPPVPPPSASDDQPTMDGWPTPADD